MRLSKRRRHSCSKGHNSKFAVLIQILIRVRFVFLGRHDQLLHHRQNLKIDPLQTQQASLEPHQSIAVPLKAQVVNFLGNPVRQICVYLQTGQVNVKGWIDTAFIRDNFPERYALKDQDGIVNPDHIADAYWMLHTQPRDAWTHELDLRPYMEKF